MAITYPLTLPASPASRQIKLSAVKVAGLSTAPFSGQQQVQEWPGEWWEAEVSLPTTMVRNEAEPWICALIAMRGVVGTCLLGDPAGRAPRGVASGAPVVDGTNAVGSKIIATRGWTPGTAGILKAGDYFHVISGGKQRLYKSLTDVNADGAGKASLDIFPALREVPADGAALTVNDAKGLFRLADNRRDWDIDQALMYGITFKVREAF